MPFVFLLLFALVCLQTRWPERPSWLTDAGAAMLIGTMIVASWLSAGLIARALCWLVSRQPDRRASLMRLYARMRRWHFILLLAVYLMLLYLLGWGSVLARFFDAWTPAGLRSEGNPPLGFQIGLLAPFFIGLIASWERFYLVEKTAYEGAHDNDRFLTRGSYLLLQIRHQFFIVLPPIIVMTFLQATALFFANYEKRSSLLYAVTTIILVAAVVSMPWLLRIFLGLKPLPPGPLRERLECAAARLRFRYSNVLVWHTRHLFANALVTGFVPWIRYIVLTDRLIDELTPDEIEAVFGHEVGHIKHHHLFFYLAFFLTSIIVLGLAWDTAAAWINVEDIKTAFSGLAAIAAPDDDTLETLGSFLKLGLLAGYMAFFFGFLSRRCERQADLFGAHTVSTEVFISALEKVADINGIPRRRFSWLHPTIAQRVEFLQTMRDEPGRIREFNLSIRLMQWTLYLFLGVLLFVVWKFDLLDVWKLLMET